MKAASPIDKLGKMIWKETVKANWIRARNVASRSIGFRLVKLMQRSEAVA